MCVPFLFDMVSWTTYVPGCLQPISLYANKLGYDTATFPVNKDENILTWYSLSLVALEVQTTQKRKKWLELECSLFCLSRN